MNGARPRDMLARQGSGALRSPREPRAAGPALPLERMERMHRLSRIVLWVLGLAFPVFLAACYGPPHRYTRLGNVAGGPRDPATEPARTEPAPEAADVREGAAAAAPAR